MKIGDVVRLKYKCTKLIGTIIGIWEEDQFIDPINGSSVKFAQRGDFKVSFKGHCNGEYQTYSGQCLEMI